MNLSNGDARFALNTLEMASVAVMNQGVRSRRTWSLMQPNGVQRSMTNPARHTSTQYGLAQVIRDSDPDATMYWLCRMLEGGDGWCCIPAPGREGAGGHGLRASMQVAMAAQQAVHFLGVPEGSLALAEAAICLCDCSKEQCIVSRVCAQRDDVQKTRNDPVPMHLRNAVTGLMRGLGYGRGYEYAHDDADTMVGPEAASQESAGAATMNRHRVALKDIFVERIEERGDPLAKKFKGGNLSLTKRAGREHECGR